MQASIDDYLAIDIKEVLKRQLRSSYNRTALALVSLGLTAHLAYEAFVHEDAGFAFLAVVVALFTFFVLIGHTPRRGMVFGMILRPRDYWPASTIHDNATKRARVAAAKSAIRTGEDLNPDAFRMRRHLKILLISRLLGAVAMAMIWVAFTWNAQLTARAEHVARFGTEQGVTVFVDLEGNETVTIDPAASPGSVRRTIEQPSRLPLASPTVQLDQTPQADPTPAVLDPAPAVLETAPQEASAPIVPPNPPLPSYWPPITEGYSVTIYDRTPSGALKLVEMRLQYGDGAMYAVGP